jgi:hypothetical protein
MTTDPERGPCKGESYSVVERGAGGHEGGGGNGAGIVQLGDGTVDAGRETEVVRIDDEANCHRDETRVGKTADECGALGECTA